MPRSGTSPGRPDSPLADAEFLTRTEHRVPLLAALAAEPRRRRELEELVDVSRTTIGRTLRAMERRAWVERDGDRFEATPLGAFVSSSVDAFVECLETERRLRDVWDLLPTGVEGFDLEACTDAVVTVAEADDPYAPVNRWVTLLDGSDRLRFVGYDIGLFEPCKDELRRFILDDMRAEIVDPPEHARNILESYPEYCEPMFESGNLTVRVHDGVPEYGLGILDDRVVIAGFHPEDGTARVLVDTDAPSIREWATDTYGSYWRDARPFSDDPTA